MPVPDLDALYKEFVIAQAANDLELAAAHGQEILRYDPNYKQGTFAPQVQKVLQRLHPLRVERHRQQAIQANKAGMWDQEIDAWREVLKLEPRDFQAKERLPVAEHNQRYAWMYENARQLVKNGMSDAAKIVLQELWTNAPYYGDPATLAKKAGLQAPPSYEKAKDWMARETSRIERETSRRRLMSTVGYSSPPLIYFCILCLVGGLGSTVGLLSQSWLWAIITVSLTTWLSYVIAYRKVVNVPIMLCIAAIGGLIAFACAWYASTLHYDQSQMVQGLFGARNMVIKAQLLWGLFFGLACPFAIFALAMEHDGGLASLVPVAGALAACMFLIFWPLLMLLGTLFGFGFGFGFGWEFSFIPGILFTVFNSIGVATTSFIAFRTSS